MVAAYQPKLMVQLGKELCSAASTVVLIMVTALTLLSCRSPPTMGAHEHTGH
eukprot:jgi/Mesvir1/13855/Mv25595-RA.1